VQSLSTTQRACISSVNTAQITNGNGGSSSSEDEDEQPENPGLVYASVDSMPTE
jgi:hypothetical protein